MRSALIGSTGFVGSSLLRQRAFDVHYNSRNIGLATNQAFDLVVCAGAPAQKWIANRDPDADRRALESLRRAVESVSCEQFILISTVDVYSDPVNVDEHCSPAPVSGNAYGLHRLELEELVRSRFERSLVVRLPGLVGPGLKKNVIYDLQHDNNLEQVDSRGCFQFYPLVQLWADISVCVAERLGLVHLTAEPISVAEIALEAFGTPFQNHLSTKPASYDFQSVHSALWEGRRRYQYNRRESLLAIRAYRQAMLQRAEAVVT